MVIADVQEIEDILLRSKLQKAIESRYGDSETLTPDLVDNAILSEMTRAAFDGVMPEGMISLKTGVSSPQARNSDQLLPRETTCGGVTGALRRP